MKSNIGEVKQKGLLRRIRRAQNRVSHTIIVWSRSGRQVIQSITNHGVDDCRHCGRDTANAVLRAKVYTYPPRESPRRGDHVTPYHQRGNQPVRLIPAREVSA